MYLFEDVCKMRPTASFEVNEHPHYSDICEAFDKTGVGVFGLKNEDFIPENKNASTEAISEQ